MDAWLAQDKLFPLLPGTTQEQMIGIVASVVLGPSAMMTARIFSAMPISSATTALPTVP